MSALRLFRLRHRLFFPLFRSIALASLDERFDETAFAIDRSDMLGNARRDEQVEAGAAAGAAAAAEDEDSAPSS